MDAAVSNALGVVFALQKLQAENSHGCEFSADLAKAKGLAGTLQTLNSNNSCFLKISDVPSLPPFGASSFDGISISNARKPTEPARITPAFTRCPIDQPKAS